MMSYSIGLINAFLVMTCTGYNVLAIKAFDKRSYILFAVLCRFLQMFQIYFRQRIEPEKHSI
jgi:hypothetical protein